MTAFLRSLRTVAMNDNPTTSLPRLDEPAPQATATTAPIELSDFEGTWHLAFEQP